ncbi:MAG: hypothetical protein RBJ76_01735 [Stenomitos frigidus ULC029]
MIVRYILAWMPMVLIGIFNGIIRESTYGKQLSELRSHQLSTVTGIVFFGFYIGLLIHFWGFASPEQALTVGLIWVALTVVFEFIFGHFVAGQTWSQLLGDYNLFAGRLWGVLLLWLALAPLVLYRVLH